MPAPDSLRARLESLDKAGVRAFDSPTVRLINGLLERAEALGGGAAERLRARASTRLDVLEQRFSAARGAAARAVDEVAAAGFDRGAVDTALAAGDLVAVSRAVRRTRALSERPARLPRRLAVIPTVRPERPRLFLADTPRTGAAPVVASSSAQAMRQHVAAELAERYRISLAEISTKMSIERAHRTLPAEAGPYNGQVIAARLLETLAGLSAVYAHAQIERMRELALLSLLPEPPPPAGQQQAQGPGKPAPGKSASKPASKRASKTPSKQATRLVGQRVSKPASKSAQPASKPANKPASKSAQPASKPASKSAQPASKPANKPASKSASKSAQPASKPSGRRR